MVPGLKKSKSPRTFFGGPGTSRPLFYPCISQEFAKSTLSLVQFINKFELSQKPYQKCNIFALQVVTPNKDRKKCNNVQCVDSIALIDYNFILSSLWDKTQRPVISDCLAFRLRALYVTNSELQRAAKLLALAATTATTQLSLVQHRTVQCKNSVSQYCATKNPISNRFDTRKVEHVPRCLQCKQNESAQPSTSSSDFYFVHTKSRNKFIIPFFALHYIQFQGEQISLLSFYMCMQQAQYS